MKATSDGCPAVRDGSFYHPVLLFRDPSEQFFYTQKLGCKACEGVDGGEIKIESRRRESLIKTNTNDGSSGPDYPTAQPTFRVPLPPPSTASGHSTIQRLQLVVNPFAWTISLRWLVISSWHNPTFSYVIRCTPCVAVPTWLHMSKLLVFVEDNSIWISLDYYTEARLGFPIFLRSCCVHGVGTTADITPIRARHPCFYR